MKDKLIDLLKLDKAATDDLVVNRVADILAANKEGVKETEALLKRLKALEEETPTGAIKVDPRVRQKMAAGLTFQQATEVVASQEAADKQAKASK